MMMTSGPAEVMSIDDYAIRHIRHRVRQLAMTEGFAAQDIEDIWQDFIVNLLERLAQLPNKTTLRHVGNEWVEITTPYLDRHNDYIQIYARRCDGGFLLTDDGYAIGDLERFGCNLKSPKCQNLLRMTLNLFGVRVHERALEVHATPDNFVLRMHNLVRAILAVNGMALDNAKQGGSNERQPEAAV